MRNFSQMSSAAVSTAMAVGLMVFGTGCAQVKALTEALRPAPTAVPAPAQVQTSTTAAKAGTERGIVRRKNRLEDANALPYVGSQAKQAYDVWLTKPEPKAFAISEQGYWAGTWGLQTDNPSQPKDPSDRALWACSKNGVTKCKLYAVDAVIVWGDDAMPSQTSK